MLGNSLVSPLSLSSCNGARFSTYIRSVIPGDNRQQPDAEDDDEDEEGKGGRSHRRKKDEYPMDLDASGLPIIPAVDDLSLESKKSLIRTFLTKYYSKLRFSVILQSSTTSEFFLRVLLPTAQGIGSLVSRERHSRRLYRLSVFAGRPENQGSIQASISRGRPAIGFLVSEAEDQESAYLCIQSMAKP